jgi:1-aminocyclopropane-1-carboxylate deaminase
LQQQFNKQFSYEEPKGKLELVLDYHFGGYAKTTKELLQFQAEFQNEFQIPLDKIYTAKLFYAIFDLLKKDFFQIGEKIVLIHTGGLQGN